MDSETESKLVSVKAKLCQRAIENEIAKRERSKEGDILGVLLLEERGQELWQANNILTEHFPDISDVH